MSTSSIFVRVTIPLAVAISLGLASDIYAVRVVGSVSGEVKELRQVGDGVIPDGVDVADPFSASFSYESDAVACDDCEPDPNIFVGDIAIYGEGLDLEMSFVIDSQSDGVYAWRGESPVEQVWVMDDFGQTVVDPFFVDSLRFDLDSDYGSFTSFPNSLQAWEQMVLNLEGGDSFTTSTSLPISNADLDLEDVIPFGSNTTRAEIRTYNEGYYLIKAELDLSTFTLGPVPEPSTCSLALAATLLFAGRWREGWLAFVARLAAVMSTSLILRFLTDSGWTIRCPKVSA